MARSGQSALSTSAQYKKKKDAEEKELLPKMYPSCYPVTMRLQALRVILLYFSSVQPIGTVSNESLEQLGENKAFFVALFLT